MKDCISILETAQVDSGLRGKRVMVEMRLTTIVQARVGLGVQLAELGELVVLMLMHHTIHGCDAMRRDIWRRA